MGKTWAAQVEIPLAVGGGSVPVVLPGVANVAGNPPGARQGRGETWRCGAGRGSLRSGGRLLAGVGEGFPDVLLGVAIAAGNAHFVNSWIPKDRHPLATVEGCGTQVRERGLCGAGNHVFRPVLAQSQSSPTWRSQKGLVFGVKAFTAPPLC